MGHERFSSQVSEVMYSAMADELEKIAVGPAVVPMELFSSDSVGNGTSGFYINPEMTEVHKQIEDRLGPNPKLYTDGAIVMKKPPVRDNFGSDWEFNKALRAHKETKTHELTHWLRNKKGMDPVLGGNTWDRFVGEMAAYGRQSKRSPLPKSRLARILVQGVRPIKRVMGALSSTPVTFRK